MKRSTKNKTTYTRMYCGHCEKETNQKLTDGGHERDSSNDKQECLECGWSKLGSSDEWIEPSVDNWRNTYKKEYKNYYMDWRNFVKRRL